VESAKPDEVEIELPLQEATPGEMTLLVRQYGANQPQSLPLRTFSEAGHLERFALHAGDSQGVLRGNRLDRGSTTSCSRGRVRTRSVVDH